MAVSPLETLLQRFEVTVLKDKSPTDKAQVPVAASVDVHKQGATVKTAITVPWPNPPDDVFVDVYHIGDIVVGDQLGLNGNSPAVLTVTSVVSVSQIGVFNLSGQPVNLAIGDRLVITTNRPTIYVDADGKVPKAAPVSTLTSDANTGRAGGYVRLKRFDYVISGGGISPARVFPDAAGGLIHTQSNWINVLDYPSIQAAVDAVPPDGGVVYIPSNGSQYTPGTVPSYTPPLVLPHDRAIHLLGDGPFRTYLKSLEINVDMIKMGGDHQTIEGLSLMGPNGDGTGRGVVIWRTGEYSIPFQFVTAKDLVYRNAIKDCRIFWTASYGIYVDESVRDPLVGAQGAVWGFYDNVEVRENRTGGCVYVAAGKTTTQWFKNCNFKTFKGYGVRLKDTAGISLIDCIIENALTDTQPYLSIEGSSSILVQHCWFEGVTGASSGEPNWSFIETSGFAPRGVTIDSCMFHRASTQSPTTKLNPKAILIRSGARNVAIISPTISLSHPASDPPASGGYHIDLESDVQAVMIGGVLSDSAAIGEPRIRDSGGASGESNTMLVNALRRFRLSRVTDLQKLALKDLTIGDTVWVVDPVTPGQNLQVWNGTQWKVIQLM